MSYIGNQPTVGQYRKLDDISGSFNGSLTAFTMQVGSTNVSAGSVFQLLVSLGGVIQEPGTDFTVSGSTITFTTAPAASLSFFGILMGQPLNTATPGDSTVTGAKIVDGTITGAKLAAAFNYDSGLLFLDDTNNRVGIGTTSPDTAVTVSEANVAVTSSSSNVNIYANDALAADIGGSIGLGATWNGTGGLINYGSIHGKKANGTSGNTDGYMSFVVRDNSGTSERMRIDSSGNVGLGNTSPAGRLHCEETGARCDLFVTSNVSTDTTASRVALGNDLGDARLTMSLFGSTGERGVIGTEGSAPVVFQTGGSERLRILSGGGLTFNGDTATANALDDYEEGNWTPSISGATLSGGSAGTYTRIGRFVCAYYNCPVGSHNNDSTVIVIAGLPFTGHQNSGGFMINVRNGIDHTIQLTSTRNSNSWTEIKFLKTVNDGNATNLVLSDCNTSWHLAGAVVYHVQ